MAERFQKQADELAEILERTGWDQLELGRKLRFKNPDTIRKVVKGYQRLSERTMEFVRMIAREETEKQSRRVADQPGEYGSDQHKQLAFIQRNNPEAEKEAVAAVLNTMYERGRHRLKQKINK